MHEWPVFRVLPAGTNTGRAAATLQEVLRGFFDIPGSFDYVLTITFAWLFAGRGNQMDTGRGRHYSFSR